MIHKHVKIVFLVVTLIIISGCMSTVRRGHVAAQSSDPAVRASALAMKLRQQGIQIIEVGETVAIVVPADQLFKGNSANLAHNSFQRLNLIADFLRIYSKTFVEIGGYTDYSGNLCDAQSLRRAKMITGQQAASVSKYLWAKGIDSRMLYAIGYGSEYPISKNNAIDGNIKNRRIEIHFQY